MFRTEIILLGVFVNIRQKINVARNMYELYLSTKVLVSSSCVGNNMVFFLDK